MTSSQKRQIAAIIPARYQASRFPGKPLAKIAGKTMIERVHEQVKKVRGLDRVIVATDDDRIRAEVERFGGEFVMTRNDHPSGTDRLAEVAEKHPEIDVIVNVQGDEPLIDPLNVEQAFAPFLVEKDLQMGTLAWHIKIEEEALSSNVVKVVVDKNDFALYFSRLPIPFYRDDRSFEERKYLGHVGMYVYSRDCLLKIASLKPTPLETSETLEQLRALENGIPIKVSYIESRSLAVDLPEDVEKVERALKVLRT
ncbi:MAG: 3-deoxy-manno-octulosonate cytidylyltransferase [Candidatus Melainabacteria bacterium]|jgi:3-deoxy-manno-octulosonate cytidylyltransferase (CMP-KDO synthetase)|nr:3-deoxy-manno-octulosonate cytidylyltransferase [Candidatus Melainabacteria bacterium]